MLIMNIFIILELCFYICVCTYFSYNPYIILFYPVLFIIFILLSQCMHLFTIIFLAAIILVDLVYWFTYSFVRSFVHWFKLTLIYYCFWLFLPFDDNDNKMLMACTITYTYNLCWMLFTGWFYDKFAQSLYIYTYVMYLLCLVILYSST